jgi:hypothetical protein
LAIVGICFIVNGIRGRAHEAWLIRQGVHVDARVVTADGETVKHRPESPLSVVQLRFTWQGKDHEPPPRALEGRHEGDFVVTWSILPIHVNPNDPDDWTWLDQPQSIFTRMIGPIVVMPMALLALLWAMHRRRRALQIWREGKPMEALIVDARSVAVAPSCRVARVTPVEERDQRVFTVYLPARLAKLGRGDVVSILKSDGDLETAMAAAWFE